MKKEKRIQKARAQSGAVQDNAPADRNRRQLIAGAVAATVMAGIPALAVIKLRPGLKAKAGTSVDIAAWKHRSEPHFESHPKNQA